MISPFQTGLMFAKLECVKKFVTNKILVVWQYKKKNGFVFLLMVQSSSLLLKDV